MSDLVPQSIEDLADTISKFASKEIDQKMIRFSIVDAYLTGMMDGAAKIGRLMEQS